MTRLESGSRETFLRGCQAALDSASRRSNRPIPKLDGAPPTVRSSAAITDHTRTFTEAARAAGAIVRISSSASISDIIDEATHLAGPGPVAISEDYALAGAPSELEARGLEIITPRSGARSLARASLGITRAVAGIARTGTIVVESGPSRTRLVSSLPPAHLAILSTDTLYQDPGDFLRALPCKPSSSALTLITGPSRSADIELVITIGVHGPKHLIIFLVES